MLRVVAVRVSREPQPPPRTSTQQSPCCRALNYLRVSSSSANAATTTKTMSLAPWLYPSIRIRRQCHDGLLGRVRSSRGPQNYHHNHNHHHSSIQPKFHRQRSFGTRTNQIASTSFQHQHNQQHWWQRIRERFTSTYWRRVALMAKYVRIPVLVASVYSLGYQQGIMDCTKTPVQLSQQILRSILLSVGVTDPSKQVRILSEDEISQYLPAVSSSASAHQQHRQVAAVGHKIVTAARAHVEEEFQKAIREVKSQLPVDLSDEQTLLLLNSDENIRFWTDARYRLQGERGSSLQKTPWQYIFITSPSPNAFVTEILPQRFFITTSMLSIATNPDELAIVLGHEVSHLILGHVSRTNMLETTLRTIEVLLLSMDPTAGVLSLLVIGTLAATRRALTAQESRDNEFEADELGVRLAARACFDTRRGCEVIRKMHDHKVSVQPHVPEQQLSTTGLMDTHPPTMERYTRMKALSQVENLSKYDDVCDTYSARLRKIVWRMEEEESNEVNEAAE